MIGFLHEKNENNRLFKY